MRLRPVPALALAASLALVGAACSSGGGGTDRAALDQLLGQALTTGERAIQIPGENGFQLSGTLTVPPGVSVDARAPAVVFVPTLGPGDRDGPIRRGGVPDRVYQDMSTELVARGFVTFRYDRRGTGRSTLVGDRADLSLDDVVADARMSVDFLAQRAEIDPDRISVVAFDQGGFVALRLAAAEERIDRLVLLSVPGRPLVEVAASELPPAERATLEPQLRGIVSSLIGSRTLPDLNSIPSQVRSLFATDPAAFLAEVFSVDPAADASGVDVPTLVVVSTAEPGVSKVDADRLAAAMGPSAQVIVNTSASSTLQPARRALAADPALLATDDVHEHDIIEVPSSLSGRQGPALEAVLTWMGAGAQ